MGVNQIEMADKILDLKDAVNECPAHIVYVIYKIVMWLI